MLTIDKAPEAINPPYGTDMLCRNLIETKVRPGWLPSRIP